MYKLYTKSNYFIVEDETTGFEIIREPKIGIKFKILADMTQIGFLFNANMQQSSTFIGNSDVRTFEITEILDGDGNAFANTKALISFLSIATAGSDYSVDSLLIDNSSFSEITSPTPIPVQEFAQQTDAKLFSIGNTLLPKVTATTTYRQIYAKDTAGNQVMADDLDTWLFNFTSLQTQTIYAPYAMQIISATILDGTSPTITITVNGSSYTYGTAIAQGDTIVVTSDIACNFKLTTYKV